jgi:hypothetical protein
VSGIEAESAMTLAFVHEATESLVQKIALLEGEHVKVREAREVAEEAAYGLSNTVASAERWWEESDRGHREQLEVLTICRPRASSCVLPLSVLNR